MKRTLIAVVLISCMTGCGSCNEEENNGENVVIEEDMGTPDLSEDTGNPPDADVDADAGPDDDPDMAPVDMYVPPPPPELVFDRQELTLRRGDSKQLAVTIAFDGEEFDPDAVAWSSSDMSIIAIDDTGLAQAQDVEGAVDITATTTFMEEEVTGTLPATVIAPYTDVGAGSSHTCGVSVTGALYCWGDNSENQSSQTMTDEFLRPHPYGNTSEFIAVEGGGEHSCALDVDGGVWCWGSNAAKQVGATADGPVSTPVQVLAQGFGELALGEAFSCAREEIPVIDPLTGGALYCWGSNESGQLGTDAMIESEMPLRIDVGGMPTRWSDVAVGDRHACATTVDGATYCWGDNRANQLGEGTMMVETHIPTLVTGDYVTLAAGGDLTCGIDGGSVFCWGTSSGGFGGVTNSAAPIEVTIPMDVTATRIVLGDEFGCASGADGGAFCWGANTKGQLGDRTTVSRDTAEYVDGEPPFGVMAGGGEHACGLNQTGDVFCWGANEDGQVGDGTQLNRLRPTYVLPPR